MDIITLGRSLLILMIEGYKKTKIKRKYSIYFFPVLTHKGREKLRRSTKLKFQL